MNLFRPVLLIGAFALVSSYTTLIEPFSPPVALAATEAFGSGQTWLVGPDREHKRLGAISRNLKDGDTVLIDAGVYKCDTSIVWYANNVTVKGVNGRAVFDATGCSISGGKGILNPRGENLIIENLEFIGARVGDNNGAGIRYDGGGEVYIRHSVFRENQNGILFTPEASLYGDTTNLTIEHSVFSKNGSGSGQTHNLYINRVNKFIFQYNYSELARVGHLVKTRAKENHILYNRIVGLDTGTDSYNIDISEGGIFYLIGNVLQQSPKSPNRAMVSYAPEQNLKLQNGQPDREMRLYIVNNTIVNDHTNQTGSSFINLYDYGIKELVIKNNIIVGLPSNRVYVVNKGTLDPAVVDMSDNLISNDPGFIDRAGFNYYLESDSPAVNTGANPGSGNGVALTPTKQYVHLANFEARQTSGAIDLGAFEHDGNSNAVPTLNFSAESIVNYDGSVTLRWSTQNAIECSAAGGWAGTKAVSGSETIENLTFNKTFSLTCHGRGGSVTESVSVSVRENPELSAYPSYEFKQLVGTKIRPLCDEYVTKYPKLRGTVGCGSLDGSNATYVPEQQSLYLWGGEPRNYYGNEVYKLNVRTGTIQHATFPTDPTATLDYNPDGGNWATLESGGCDGILTLKDGSTTVAPRASWHNFEHIPEIGKIYFHGGQSVSCLRGTDRDGWFFDVNSHTWEMKYDNGAPHQWAYTWYDPKTGVVLVGGDEREIYRYNYNTNTFTNLGSKMPQTWKRIGAGIHPEKRLLIFVGQSTDPTDHRFSTIDISSVSKDSTGTLPARKTNWTITGDTTILETREPGIAYDSKHDMLVGIANGLNKIYFFDIDEVAGTVNIVSKRFADGDMPKLNAEVDTTFRYLPEFEAFSVYAGVNTDFYLLQSTGANYSPEDSAPEKEEESVTAPSCDLDVSRNSINSGESTTLFWTVENGTLAIDNAVGSFTSNGSMSVSPTESVVYKGTVTATNGSTDTCTVKITVDDEEEEVEDEQPEDDVADDGAVQNGGGTIINKAYIYIINIDRVLVRGVKGPDVLELQRLLNSDPRTRVAASGAGSLGNETEYYGPATENAVKRFQSIHGVVSSGAPTTTGYGAFGPQTRAKVAEVFARGLPDSTTKTKNSAVSDEEIRKQIAELLQLIAELQQLLLERQRSGQNAN